MMASQGNDTVPLDLEKDFTDMDSPPEDDENMLGSDVRKNLLQDLVTPFKPAEVSSDHMQVYLRIRPFTTEEIVQGERQNCLSCSSDGTVTAHAPKDSVTYKNSAHGSGKAVHKFGFTKVFKEDTTQKELFDKALLSTVKEFITGQNRLVFSYGATNSGKSYTIQGNVQEPGLIPRTLDVLFNSIDGKQLIGMPLKPRMFGDVARLSPRQEELEYRLKESVLKMAADEGADLMMSMIDATQVSDLSTNTTSTTMSEDSLMTSRIADADASIMDKWKHEDIDSMLDDAVERAREDASIELEGEGPIKFSVWVSFAEIYNENIYDLLEPLPKKKHAKRLNLHLREDKNGSPYIKGLKHVNVKSADEAYRILTVGKKNLQIACTKLNHCSSRSHCIFTIKVVRVVDKADPHHARFCMLSVCDLAGSERSAKTQTTGDRLKEAGNINTSLLTLGRCIKTLRFNQLHKSNQQIVPFRESKLTRLFQGFFCGKGKAAMIINVNQCASLFDETLQALKFSAIAQKVIVVQEAEKPKKPLRSSRQVSLALAAPTSGLLSRHSIAWATPNARMRALEEEAANLPIPEEDEYFDSDAETREQEYLALIQELRQSVVEANQKIAVMEVEIREEVCAEMAKQLVEIEESYSERLKEEHMLAEEKAERRIELFTKSVMKNRKRARIEKPEEEEEDELVRFSLLLEEQAKVKKLEQQLGDLTAEMDEMKVQMTTLQTSQKVASQERDKVVKDNSKLQFEAADLRTSVSSLKMEVKKLQTGQGKAPFIKVEKVETPDGGEMQTHQKPAIMKTADGSSVAGDIEQAELIQSLSQQLKHAQQQLADKENEVADVNEMLSEAGETFQQKDNELKQLQNVIGEYEEKMEQQANSLADLQQVVNESQGVIQDLNAQLMARDSAIHDQEKEVVALKEKTGVSTDAAGKLEAQTAEVARLETLVEEAQRALKVAEDRAATEQNEVGRLKTVVTEKDDVITDFTSKYSLLERSLDNHKSALSDSEAFVADLNEKLREKDEQLQSKDAAMIELREKLEAGTLQNENEMTRLREELETEKLKCENEMTQVREKLEAETLEYENEIRETNESKEMLSEQLTELKQKLSSQEQIAQQLKDKLQVAEETARCKDSEANVAENEKISGLEALLAEAVQRESEIKENCSLAESRVTQLTEQVAELEAAVQLARERQNEGESLGMELSALKGELKEEKEKSGAANQKLRSLQGELDDKLAEFEKRVNALTESVQESDKALTEKVAECEERQAEHQMEVNEQKRQLVEYERQVSGLEQSLQQANTEVRESALQLQQLMDERNKSEEKAIIEDGHISEMKAKLDELTSQYDKKVSELNEAQENSKLKIEQLNCQLEIARQGEFDVMEMNTELEAKLEKLGAQAQSSAEEQAHRGLLEQERLEAEVNEHRQRVEKLQSELQEYQQTTKTQETQIQEYEKRMEKLETELTEERMNESRLEDSYNKLNETLNERKQKVCNLEDVIRELRNCLTSSKTTEAHTEKLLKDIKVKNHHLEDEIMTRDDKIAGLEQEVEENKQCVSEMQELIESLKTTCRKLEQDDAKKGDRCVSLEGQLRNERENMAEMNHLQDQIQNLERQLTDKDACLQQMRRSLASVEGQLEEQKVEIQEKQRILDERQRLEDEQAAELDSIETQLCELQKTLEDKADQLEQAEHGVKDKSSEICELKREESHRLNEIERLQRDLAAVQSELSRTRDEMTQLNEGFAEKMTEAEKLQQQKTEKCEVLEKDANAKTLKIEELERVISDIQQELQDKSTQGQFLEKMQEELAEKQKQTCSLQQKVDSQAAELNSLTQTLSDRKKELEGLNQILSDKSAETDSQKLTVESLSQQIEELKQTLSQQTQEKLRLQHTTDDRLEQISDLEKEISLLKEKTSKLQELEDRHDSLKSDYEGLRVENSTLNIQFTNKEIQLESATNKSEELDRELKRKDKIIQDYGKQMTVLKEEVSNLTEKTERLSTAEAAVRDALKNTEEKLTTKTDELVTTEEKLTSKTEELVDMTAKLKCQEQELLKYIAERGENDGRDREMKLLSEQLEKSREKESKLRSQLAEASTRTEAQNAKFIEVEDKLRSADDLNFQNNLRITELQAQIDTLQNDEKKNQSVLEQTKKEKKSSESCRRELEDKVTNLEEVVERLEARVKTKNSTISEMMEKFEEERKGFEVALRDAVKNEKVIEQMKVALEEQEMTMENQDTCLNRREEENKELTQELDELTTKYQELLTTQQGSTTSTRRLQQQCDLLNNKLSAADQAKKAAEQLQQEIQEQCEQLDKQRSSADEAKKAAEKLLEGSQARCAELQKSLDELRTEKDHTQADMQSLMNDKATQLQHHLQEKKELTQQLSSARTELQQLETLLSESRKEAEIMKTQHSTLLHSHPDDSHKVKRENSTALLKQKFHVLEEKCEEKDKEMSKLKEETEAKLEDFRQQRDLLVKGLEKILKEKSEENSQLQSKISVLKAKTTISHPSIKKEVIEESEFEAKLKDKDEIITALTKELERREKEVSEEKTPVVTRGRKGKSVHMEKKEVENLQKQLTSEYERHAETSRRLDRALHARDEVLCDLKQANLTLQSRVVSLEEHLRQTETVEEPQAPRRTTRGRRKQSDSTSESSVSEDIHQRPRRSSRATTASARRSRKTSHSVTDPFDENDKPSDIMSIKEEELIDLDEQSHPAPSKSGRRTVLSRLHEDPSNVQPPDIQTKDVCPTTPERETPTMKSPPTTGRRKRRLLADQMQPPFDCSPHVTVTEEKHSAQEIVTRKLRRTRRN